MVHPPQRTAISGPALVRLLARLTQADVPESRQSLADRLSQWLGWTDAIALSTALSGPPPAVAGVARAFGSAEERECARVRAGLAQTLAGDSAFAVARRRGATLHGAAVEAPVDYAVFRQRYTAMQQTMETGIGSLRGRLRAMLATQTPALARLAVLDAVMERALGERERSVLATVPGLLAGHFQRLRAQAEAKAASAGEGATDAAAVAAAVAAGPAAVSANEAAAAATKTSPDAAAHTAWLSVFRQDMQSVVLAELDVRFQPVEGLIAALRTC
ncbi:DUF3348 domain-containing protein [Paraburkholderia sp. BCC1886]|uniref:DUF3348 domain-containing protein n=1 Tax=Paraburkholderia sp. BCC1886 TaxID=2562670 RepID=UPI00118361B1|nr:DUF3348 domain-containing protein [Paraburkholderia sp. BCC1886]